MNRSKILFLLACVFALFSCSQKKDSKKIPTNAYAEFLVVLGEGVTSKMQCIATFKQDNEDGDGMSLGEGTQVLIDGNALRFDTIFEPCYADELDADRFPGKHEWQIIRPDQSKQVYSFETKPFRITSELPKTVGKEDVLIKCDALKKGDTVTLIISGDYDDNTESVLDFPADEGAFTIPASYWKTIGGTDLRVHFNISAFTRIPPDGILSKGGTIEVSRVTEQYAIVVEK